MNTLDVDDKAMVMVNRQLLSVLDSDENVFIGCNCLILKGTTIGDNTTVGAGSVVSGMIPANCVAAGNPAKVIRTKVIRTID